MNDISKTDPPPAGIVPSTLPENDIPTGDLTKEKEASKALREIGESFANSFVNLRTDIETMSSEMRSLTERFVSYFNNLAQFGEKLDSLQSELDSLKCRLERLPCWQATLYPPPCPLESERNGG